MLALAGESPASPFQEASSAQMPQMPSVFEAASSEQQELNQPEPGLQAAKTLGRVCKDDCRP